MKLLYVEIKWRTDTLYYKLTNEDGSIVEEEMYSQPASSGGEGAIMSGMEHLAGMLLELNEPVLEDDPTKRALSNASALSNALNVVQKMVKLHNKRFAGYV